MAVKFIETRFEDLNEGTMLAWSVACRLSKVELKPSHFTPPCLWWQIWHREQFIGLLALRNIDLDEKSEVWICCWGGIHKVRHAIYAHLHKVMQELGLRFLFTQIYSSKVEWLLLNHGWQSTGRIATYVQRRVNGHSPTHPYRSTERRPVGWSHYLRNLPGRLLQVVGGKRDSGAAETDATDDRADGVER